MRFFLDHDVPGRVAGVLQHAKHDVVRLSEVLPATTDDQGVFEYSRGHGLILITCNRDDFLPLAKQGDHPGLIVLIRRKSRIAECSALLKLIDSAGVAGLAGNINFA